MTAKEALRARIDLLGEDDAAALLSLADAPFLEWLEGLSKSTTTAELLTFPGPLQSLLTRYEARYYTEADAERDLAEFEEWQAGTGADVDLI